MEISLHRPKKSFAVIRRNLLNSLDDRIHILISHEGIKRNAHDALIYFLCDWTQSLLVAALLIEGEVVDRNVVYLALNILGAQGIEELAPCAGEPVFIQADDIQMPCGV